MISTNAKANRYRDYYYGRYHEKDYDKIAAEYVSAREAKIAKEKQAKMSAKDKEAAEELKKATGEKTDDKDDDKDGDKDDKKEEKKEDGDKGGDDADDKKEEEKKGDDGDKKKDFVPPELDKKAAEKPKKSLA